SVPVRLARAAPRARDLASAGREPNSRDVAERCVAIARRGAPVRGGATSALPPRPSSLYRKSRPLPAGWPEGACSFTSQVAGGAAARPARLRRAARLHSRRSRRAAWQSLPVQYVARPAGTPAGHIASAGPMVSRRVSCRRTHAAATSARGSGCTHEDRPNIAGGARGCPCRLPECTALARLTLSKEPPEREGD